jgi:hypothetical protein
VTGKWATNAAILYDLKLDWPLLVGHWIAGAELNSILIGKSNPTKVPENPCAGLIEYFSCLP